MEVAPVNLFEFEALCKERLPKPEWDFIEGGATDEITIGRTRKAFDSIMLRLRMLADMDVRDLSTTVLGERIDYAAILERLLEGRTLEFNAQIRLGPRGKGAGATKVRISVEDEEEVD